METVRCPSGSLNRPNEMQQQLCWLNCPPLSAKQRLNCSAALMMPLQWILKESDVSQVALVGALSRLT